MIKATRHNCGNGGSHSYRDWKWEGEWKSYSYGGGRGETHTPTTGANDGSNSPTALAHAAGLNSGLDSRVIDSFIAASCN